MKKLFTILLVTAFVGSVSAQNDWGIPKEKSGLLTKITATWCGPCGDWGWDAMTDLMADYGDDHIVISLYAPSSSKLHNADATTFADEIGFGGTPNFAGNGLDQGTVVSSASVIVDTFQTSAPIVANAAYEIEKVNNDTVTIKVKVKFFEDVDGKFELRNFLVENHVVEEQASQGPDAQHHNVHRGNFVDVVDGSDIVTEDGADKNEIFVKRYEFVVEPGWKYSEMFIATTLWMENPLDAADLLYINGTKEPQLGELVDGFGVDGGGDDGEWPIGIREFENESISLYPNPAVDFFTVRQEGSGAITVEITDLLGKVVFTDQFMGSKNNVSVTGFPEGIYMVKVSNAEGTFLDRIVVK